MLKEIAENFIAQYEYDKENINLYDIYADFKREIEGISKEKTYQPIKEKPIDISKYAKTIGLRENKKTYLIQEIDWYSNEIEIQYIVKVWFRNKKYGLSQFDIVQVIYGNRYKNMLTENVFDTDKTMIVDDNINHEYNNQYTFRLLNNEDIKEILTQEKKEKEAENLNGKIKTSKKIMFY